MKARKQNKLEQLFINHKSEIRNSKGTIVEAIHIGAPRLIDLFANYDLDKAIISKVPYGANAYILGDKLMIEGPGYDYPIYAVQYCFKGPNLAHF
ncbi:hypothetical protein HYX19_01645 [Candidatus Woesearchaeota archaeon]|nr:hypothetical protein [Candidatus Woesearchaeota archaeon]